MSLASGTPLQSGQPIPRLAEPFESEVVGGDITPRAVPDGEEKKGKKRGLFGFGKKKTDETTKSATKTGATPKDIATAKRTATSPVRSMPTSPGRGFPSSPRLASPAGSQIFERDVQESAVVIPNSPAIPSHIQTENYIPPVLDASSEAITDSHLDPDSVEIITHASHQPAAMGMSGIGMGSGSGLLEPSWADELAAFSSDADRTVADSASNYGNLDTTDIRRLSFISFADVVQAEHQHTAGNGLGAGSRDSIHMAGLTSLASVGITNRSPSPIRSPVSSAGGPGTSPPTSKSGSVKGLEMSPSRKPLGSPTSIGPTVTGELSIETMSEALRRTGSGDLGGVRSFPTSPI
ncbi:hypothetical protein B0T26DRAFT_118392 [Lasiosphaeria miniovina]|uniref:Gtpase activating protein n=1 Tax=Lasiosphaeria miniovina TaxID=1954250 RepID=A0AA40E4U6_9PEZI|nr:uncharacterized protein B0T26DRAFT_118392 [Lasiosphaeria miniovina]KAK0727130.1 hypothetical protein B0T26DRAFT_118392 [Lasiosphaeria miniovina]